MTVKATEDKAQAQLGARAMQLTDKSTPEEAEGVLAAWKESHPLVAKLQGENKTLAARVDRLERVQLLRTEVARGKLTPGEAWANAEQLAARKDGEPDVEPVPADLWATAPLATVRAHLATRASKVPMAPIEAKVEADGPVETEAAKLAAHTGVDEKFVVEAQKNIRWT